MRESEDLGEEELRKLMGKEKEESFGIRVRVVKVRTGLESVICLEISLGVFVGEQLSLHCNTLRIHRRRKNSE